EGLHEIIEELRGTSETVDSLIDRIERRLMWVRNYAEQSLTGDHETLTVTVGASRYLRGVLTNNIDRCNNILWDLQNKTEFNKTDPNVLGVIAETQQMTM